MNIVILGAGQVGTSLAELLSSNNDVTVVDLDGAQLQRLQDRLDIRTVHGHASHPDILQQAGLEEADMLIAATQNDETNIIACQFAHVLYKTETKIARVRAQSYLQHPELFDRNLNLDALPIDVLISPEVLMKNYILQLIEYPGSLQVVDFAEGKVRLVAFRADSSGLLVGKKIKEIKQFLPSGVSTRIVAIYRRNSVVMPTGDVEIRAGDEVFFLAKPEHILTVIEVLRGKKSKPSKHIMIAGGGNIGLSLASELEKDHNVKVIEHGIKRAREIAESLEHTIVVQGDVSDKALLIEENVDEIDLFIAVTNTDETNIISSMMAKKLGATRVIALVNNQNYVELTQLNSIDVAISADQITTSHLLHYMHQGDTVKAFTLRRGAAEAIEIIAHGSENTSPVIGKKIGEIAWPPNITVGAIIRNDEVILAHRDVVIEAEDHVILFISDRDSAQAVTELFDPEQEKTGWRSWF
jgi:trk system potassium uptake protein TrkA